MPTFRLLPILHLREATRDERRAALADALRAEAMLHEQIADKRGEIAAIVKESKLARATGEVNVERVIQSQRYEALLRSELMLLFDQTKRVAAEVERRREALVAADRDVHVLEKLREKQALRERKEQERRVIKFLDDVAGQRFGAREDSA